MKRNLLFIIGVLITCQLVHGQPSFSEKKLRDKALNEGISYAQQGEYELAASSVMRCLELDSTFAPAWLLNGQIFIEWGVLEDARANLQMAQHYDPALGEAYFLKDTYFLVQTQVVKTGDYLTRPFPMDFKDHGPFITGR